MKTTMRFYCSVIIVASMLLLSGCSNKRLACQSSDLHVTVKYNNKTVLDYVTDAEYHFDLEALQHIAEEVGIEQLIQDYQNWFETTTDGTCR